MSKLVCLEEGLLQVVKRDGFHTGIPQFVVDVYNERDSIIYDIVSLLEQVRDLSNDRKKLMLRVRNGE